MSPRDPPLISISIPVLNEAQNLPALYTRLSTLAERMRNSCELEFVFSDNRSVDNTWAILTALSERDPRVRAIRFSKNFGFQRSILANYIHTRGDAVMQLDADLQDPPELLESFFKLWRQGYMVVYGIRKRRPEGLHLRLLRRFGYWIIERISEYPIPRDAGDFRLMDRRVIRSLVQLKTANPYLRGMIAGLGFKQTGIEYDRQAREFGQSKFPVSRLLRMGLTAVINHSAVPLRAASFLGISIVAFSLLGALYYLLLKLLHPELPQGLASIHILVLFGIGLNSFLLGIVGEYLLRIYLILRNEPIAIVEDSLNLAESDLKL